MKDFNLSKIDSNFRRNSAKLQRLLNIINSSSRHKDEFANTKCFNKRDWTN